MYTGLYMCMGNSTALYLIDTFLQTTLPTCLSDAVYNLHAVHIYNSSCSFFDVTLTSLLHLRLKLYLMHFLLKLESLIRLLLELDD